MQLVVTSVDEFVTLVAIPCTFPPLCSLPSLTSLAANLLNYF